MRIGWLADTSDMKGGAEFTQEEFRAAAPEGVEVVDCPPDGIDATCDQYVIQNCVQYFLPDLLQLEGKDVVKYWHDVGPWVQEGVRGWLDVNARPICCSKLQADYMGLDATLIPPPVNLRRFMEAAESVNGDRRGNVSVASWRNHGKAPHRVAEWAAENRSPVRFFGDGIFAPPESQGVPYEQMPELLASFKRFVYLPNVIEPFGRLVAEAWAAGCELVINGNVGAAEWIRQDPDAIERAGEDFWNVVLNP